MASAETDSTPWRDEQTLRRLYSAQEMTIAEMAEKLGCDPATIVYWIDKFKIEKRGRGGTRGDGEWRDEETLRQLYWDEDLSIVEIARELDCTPPTVQDWMEKFDIERRPAGGTDGPTPWRDEETLRRLYWDKEMTLMEVAEELDCSETVVYRWMKRFDIETRQPGDGGGSNPWQDEETLRELYWKEGLTMVEVAEELDCSPATVHYWLKKFDIDRRSNGPRSQD